MKLKTKIIIVTLIVGVPALLLGRVIWPDAPEIPTPTSVQFLFFALLQIIESLIFGLGIACAIFGWREIQSIENQRVRKSVWWAYGALIWLMINWWPHDNMHRWNGENLQGLLYIDYGFHVTIIFATLVIGKFLITQIKNSRVSNDAA